MANWIITDNGTLIQIEHEGLEVFNNPKSDTEIKIVRAKTGDNTSSVDKLYIGFDTSWPCQINWNDVTVDGVAPTDVDDFSDKVEVILNNVSTGGGLADVDDASDVTKANITSGYRVWMQDPSTADNYDISAYDFINAVTLTSAQAITLLASPNSIIVDSKYKITSLGITGVTEVIISGRNMIQGNSPAEALVTALGVYVPCTYDVATNKIQIQLTNKMFVSVDGLGGITIDSVVNNEWNGITFSATNTSGGTYLFTPSQTLQTIFTAVSMHCEQIIPQGSDAAGFASTVDDYAHDEYYYTIYNTAFGNDGSIAFPNNLITFIGYIKN